MREDALLRAAVAEVDEARARALLKAGVRATRENFENILIC